MGAYIWYIVLVGSYVTGVLARQAVRDGKLSLYRYFRDPPSGPPLAILKETRALGWRALRRPDLVFLLVFYGAVLLLTVSTFVVIVSERMRT